MLPDGPADLANPGLGGSGNGGRRSPFGRGPARNTVGGGRPQAIGRRKGVGEPFRGWLSSVGMVTPAPPGALQKREDRTRVRTDLARFVTA
jgi:hypothetical protein